jgi:hypothetical protein
MDWKQLWDGGWWIAAEDDASRLIVGYGVFHEPTAEHMIRVLKQAIDKHGRPREILTDRGSQFHANEGERKEKSASQFEAISQSERIASEFGADAYGKNAVEAKGWVGPKSQLSLGTTWSVGRHDLTVVCDVRYSEYPRSSCPRCLLAKGDECHQDQVRVDRCSIHFHRGSPGPHASYASPVQLSVRRSS